MNAVELPDIRAEQQKSGKLYQEFMRSPSLSVGLYALPAGGVDGQSPHTEDEVYYVVKGRATVFVGGEDRPVMPGSTIFVAANVEHRFHSITEDLELLVFFGPAEYSQA